MSTTSDLITALKAELKAAGITYAALAERLGMAESSVKRMFSSRGDLSLSRVDAVCRALGMDFADLARTVADSQPLLQQLSLEQEAAVVADRRLLLVAICAMSQMPLDDIVAAYTVSPADGIRCLTRLDALGIIELRPGNRYRLKVAKGFRWLPQGPVMRFFRDEVLQDYFAGGFDGEAEMLTVVHGEIGHGPAMGFRDRLIRLCQDFSSQHLADRALPAAQRQAFTLVVGMRSWLMPALRDLQRSRSARL